MTYFLSEQALFEAKEEQLFEVNEEYPRNVGDKSVQYEDKEPKTIGI